MKWALGLLGATVAGSLVVAGYNWFLEPLIPDKSIFRITRKTDKGEAYYVSILDWDDVGRTGALIAALAPFAGLLHKIPVVGAVIPAVKSPV